MSFKQKRPIGISVVVPYSGRGELLLAALYSILNQSQPPNQVVVVNDSSNSNDFKNLEARLRELRNLMPYVEILQSTRSSGPSGTRNFGLLNCKYRYIAFLDDDDLFLPWKLEKQVALMLTSGAAMSHTNYLRFESQKSMISEIDTSKHQGPNSAPFIAYRECWVATPTVMLDSNQISQLHRLFDERLRLGEDQRAWIKVLHKTKGSLAHLGMASTLVRIHTSSLQNSLTKGDRKRKDNDLRVQLAIYGDSLGLTRPPLNELRTFLWGVITLCFNLMGKPAVLRIPFDWIKRKL